MEPSVAHGASLDLFSPLPSELKQDVFGRITTSRLVIIRLVCKDWKHQTDDLIERDQRLRTIFFAEALFRKLDFADNQSDLQLLDKILQELRVRQFKTGREWREELRVKRSALLDLLSHFKPLVIDQLDMDRIPISIVLKNYKVAAWERAAQRILHIEDKVLRAKAVSQLVALFLKHNSCYNAFLVSKLLNPISDTNIFLAKTQCLKSVAFKYLEYRRYRSAKVVASHIPENLAREDVLNDIQQAARTYNIKKALDLRPIN